ncbi:MAG: hypothetical protein QM523_05240 [Candidatus Pacebacteria bacterium]|nr:hypothetical protein [Candidatus Paceibacterota bacterium]
MSSTTSRRLSFRDLASSYGNLLSLSPKLDLPEPRYKTVEERWAAAWKMTGDSMYRTLGKESPETNSTLGRKSYGHSSKIKKRKNKIAAE